MMVFNARTELSLLWTYVSLHHPMPLYQTLKNKSKKALPDGSASIVGSLT